MSGWKDLAMAMLLGAVSIPDLSGQVTWRRSFGGFGSDVGKSVRVASDGNYIVCGSTGSFGAGGGDIYLALLDPNGELIWSKTYGGSGVEQGNCVRQTADGGFIIAGLTNSYGAGGYDGYLVRTDASGNQIWDVAFGGGDWDLFSSIELALNGGYVMVGQSSSGPSGTQDGWLLRCDDTGQFISQGFYGGPGEDFSRAVVQLTSGAIVMCGGKSVGTDMDAWLVQVEDDGLVVWDSLYGGDSLDYALDVVLTSDGGFSALGSTRSFSIWSEAYHFKVDGNGGLLWEWNWGQINDQTGYDLLELSDGRFASAHATRTSGAGGQDMFILLSYPDGGFQTGSTFGGDQDDYGYSLDEATDGGFILAGATHSFGSGTQDAFVVKTGSNGLTATQDVYSQFDPLTTGTELAQNNLLIHPNPSEGEFTIIGIEEAENLKIFDATGRLVWQLRVSQSPSMDVQVELPSGVYGIVLAAKNGGDRTFSTLQIVR